VPAREAAAWTVRLAVERIAEHLRCEFVATGSPVLPPVRTAVAIARQAARDGSLARDPRLRLAQAFADLGITHVSAAPACAGADRLTAADDDAVVTALATCPEFVRAPALPGRAPETGPAARLGLSATDPAAAQHALRTELAEALSLLARAHDTVGLPQDWIRAGRLNDGAGYAAVESPRGRLHYRVRVDDDGILRDARVLAPTEWNFHPRGPLVRALMGARPAGDAAVWLAERAAAFNACVAVHVDVRQRADA